VFGVWWGGGLRDKLGRSIDDWPDLIDSFSALAFRWRAAVAANLGHRVGDDRDGDGSEFVSASWFESGNVRR
jgi:hypothetical protein